MTHPTLRTSNTYTTTQIAIASPMYIAHGICDIGILL